MQHGKHGDESIQPMWIMRPRTIAEVYSAILCGLALIANVQRQRECCADGHLEYMETLDDLIQFFEVLRRGRATEVDAVNAHE